MDSGFDFGALFRGDGEVAVAQAAGPVGVFEHDSTHAEGVVLVDFAGEGLPGECPAADSIFGVVTAATGDEEGGIELEESGCDLHVCVVGELQVGERIAGERIHTHFDDDRPGFEATDEGGDDLIECVEEGLVVGAGGEWNIYIEAEAGSGAGFIFESSPGEESFSTFMERDGQDVVTVIEGCLCAVAVVGVDIEAEDAFAVLGEEVTGEHDVIEVAEAGGFSGHGMVEAAEQGEGDIGFLLEEEVGGFEGGAAGPAAVVVEVFEHGGIRGAESHFEGLDIEVSPGGGLENIEVILVMELQEFGGGGGLAGGFYLAGGSEQAEVEQPFSGFGGAGGFEGAGGGIGEVFDLWGIYEGERSIVHLVCANDE